MKIILIARTIAFGGGAERLVYETYNELKNKFGDSNVKLVVFQHSSIFNIHGLDIYENKLINDPNFHCLNDFVKLSIFKKNNINVSQLQKIVDDFQPTIIHSHMYLAELISRQIYCPDTKWLSHFHDNMEQFDNLTLKTFFYKKKITNYFEKKHLFKKYKSNSFIAVSKDTFDYAKKRIKNHKIFLLPNAINLNEFYRFKDVNLDKIRIINIGSFVEKKNHRFIIPIANELKKRNLDFEIILLGDGPLKNTIEQLVFKNNLTDNFKFLGIVENVNTYLNNSNIYLHTAKYEPFGLVLIESMAVGLPVISLNGKGNMDLIKNGYNGYLINEENPQKFSNIIIETFNKKELYASISKNALSFSRQFDIKNYVNELIKIYTS